MDQWDEEVRTDRQTAGTKDGFGNILSFRNRLATLTHSKPTKMPTEFLLSEWVWEKSGEGNGVKGGSS